MTTTLLHISDPHFGDPNGVLSRQEVNQVLETLLVKTGPDVFVVLSGDISFRGQAQGYVEAKQALLDVFDETKVQRDRVIVCPGNHDIVKSATNGSPFEAFDAWSVGLRRDKHCTFSSDSCRRFTSPEVDFLLINSVYHGDSKYGLVDLKKMDAVLADMNAVPIQNLPRVAVLHHHVVPFSAGDTSTTRNAYQVLTRLAKHGFSLVLHGHQHALLELGIGENSMKVHGVGSFRYITPGFINGATVYRIDSSKHVTAEHYAISKDAPNLLKAIHDF
ncbi:metallophosphoesterase family protein [Lampropedia aestuarii]|uniref:metallophosphoesterase family protein n=1 Tax=Lampropedia aestuarii TaxID=2562762 RepID=UPI0024690B8F|nr:metallophosphoesterase [Lampropedia aestuarii]MDH5857784.1 metallophosphoesterase [Lampropedia aestuarii]